MTTRVPHSMIGTLSPSGGDDTARIHAALAAYDVVELTAGTFYGNVSLAGLTGKTLRGAGRYSTFLKNWAAGAVITLDNTSAPCQLHAVEGMAIVNRDEATYPTTDGILVAGGEANQQEFCRFKDLWIENFRRGISVTARLIWSSFENVHYFSCVDGFYCVTTANVSQLAFRNCRFGSNTGYGVYASKASGDTFSGWHFDTCTFESNALNGVRVSGAASGISGWTFTACYAEENALSITTLSTNPYKANVFIDASIALGVNFNGCALYGAATNPDWNVVVTSATQSGEMSANRVGTMVVGFANVGANWFFGPQAGGTGTITKATGSFSVAAMTEEAQYTPTLSLTGCTTVPTGTARAARQGADVTLYVPTITATSNTTAATLTGLPAALWPARDQSVLCRVSNGAGGIVLGLFQVAAADGVITLAADLGGGSFNNSGTKGIQLQTLTYSMI